MEQKDNNFPGLVQECNKFIEELNIVDPFKIHVSKNEWKKMVKSAVIKANSNELKHEIEEKYKKLKKSDLVNEEFDRKDYLKKLNIQQARTMFKFRSYMTQHVKMNQKSNEQYAEALWLQNTNSHLLWCTGYESLREGKDLECDQHLCDYLQKIFILRTEKLLD